MNNLLTVSEVAKRLNVSSQTIWKHIKQQKLQALKVGTRHIRISEDSLNEYLGNNKCPVENVTAE